MVVNFGSTFVAASSALACLVQSQEEMGVITPTLCRTVELCSG